MRVLIIYNMQNDYITGPLGNKEAESLPTKIKNLISHYLNEDPNNKIYIMMDTHTRDYLNTLEGDFNPTVHCIEGTYGWELVDEVYYLPSDVTIYPQEYSTYGEIPSNIDTNVDSIELCGAGLDGPILAAAMNLRALNSEVSIVINPQYVSSTSPFIQATLEKLFPLFQIDKEIQE